MRNRFTWAACVCAAALVFAATGTHAQQQYGELVVKISDQTGGVIPGASVILTSDALIRPVEGMTDSMGIFRLIDFIEQEFGVALQPSEIQVEHFRSIDSIFALVKSRGEA